MIGGTLVSQIVPLLSSIILARIYEPESFGIYAVFLTYLNVGIVLINLRYELAIVKEPTLKGSLKLFQGSLLISMSLTIISYFIIILAQFVLTTPINSIVWFIPIGCFLNGAMLLFVNLNTKVKKFNWISLSKIVQALSNALISILIGYLSLSLFGLVYGYLVGFFTFIVINVFLHRKILFTFFSWKQIQEILRRYIDFPKFNVGSSLLNAIGLSIPVWYLSWQFEKEIVGYYGLAQRIVVVPLMLISSSISQVVYEKAIDSIKNKFNLHLWLKKISFRLFLLYLLPCLVLFVFSEDIFVLAFGEDWRFSGLITKYIVFGMLTQVFLTPFSMLYPAMGKLKLFMRWQILQFTIAVLIVPLSYYLFENSLFSYLTIFTISNIIVYSLNYLLILKMTKGYQIID